MNDRCIKNHGVEASAARSEVKDRMCNQPRIICGVVTKDAVILGNATRYTAKYEKKTFLMLCILGVLALAPFYKRL